MSAASPPGATADQLRRLAIEAASAAGALLAEHASALAAGADLEVRHKDSATDPVSLADAASERAIVERLSADRPDDGILGEEGEGRRPGTTGLTWIIDPLDGTVNFLYGQPTWVVSIAVVDAEGPLAGAVLQPSTGELFHAHRGGGAWLGDRRLSLTDPAELAFALVATGFAYDRDVRTAWGAHLAGLLGQVRDIRRGGAAALDLCWVAAGRLDGYVEFALHPWDWAAGQLLVTEAGGRVSEVEVRLGDQPRGGLVAGGPRVHDALLGFLDREVSA
ncbi:MAG: inositol monophosphatase family protein [Nitriliruptoraceae bacterium]